MNNSNDVNSQLSRMRSLMKFGINEGKKVSYTGVEYEKIAADGKMYGIVREGSKYYIKTSPNKKGKLSENFEYIGGFRNRKNYEYTSFAEAQKQFDLKMMSINEANTPDKKVIIESWNPNKQEELTVEATDKMRKEIYRERQIMLNATRINEKKEQHLTPINNCKGSECKEDGYDFEDAKKPKDSFKNVDKYHEKPGDAKKANKGYKNADIKEEAEPLAWHETGTDAKGTMSDDYMDKSNDTEIGDSQPFDEKKDVVTEEGESLAIDNGENQNKPNDGTNEVGDGQPFDDEVSDPLKEEIEDMNADADLEEEDEEDFDTDLDTEDGLDSDLDGEVDDVETDLDGDDDLDTADSEETDDVEDDNDTDPELHDLQNQISDLSAKLDAVLNAVGADEPTVDTEKYSDDDLYGELDDNGDEDGDDDLAFENVNRRGYKVYESRSYRQMKMREAKRRRNVNEDELHDFGQHPAYQKKVMSLPNSDMEEMPDYYDMNDESARSTEPFGKKIGDGKPFSIDTKKLEDAIAESILRHLGKKRIR